MFALRTWTPDDLPLGMRLKSAAGWNQREADWLRAWRLEPEGCFVGLWDGVAAATLTCCRFGRVAWIALVLVDPALRGRGIAGGLLRHALEYLDAREVASVRLDATDLGRPVYEKLGFRADTAWTRYAGTVVSREGPDAADLPAGAAGIRNLRREEVEAAGRLDALAAGCDRGRLITAVWDEWPEAGRALAEGGELRGFCLRRRGSQAVQIGPCVAVDDAAGRALVADTLSAQRGTEVLLDVPAAQAEIAALVRQAGLGPQRHFTRMTRGAAVAERTAMIWASFGAEKG